MFTRGGTGQRRSPPPRLARPPPRDRCADAPTAAPPPPPAAAAAAAAVARHVQPQPVELLPFPARGSCRGPTPTRRHADDNERLAAGSPSPPSSLVRTQPTRRRRSRVVLRAARAAAARLGPSISAAARGAVAPESHPVEATHCVVRRAAGRGRRHPPAPRSHHPPPRSASPPRRHRRARRGRPAAAPTPVALQPLAVGPSSGPPPPRRCGCGAGARRRRRHRGERRLAVARLDRAGGRGTSAAAPAVRVVSLHAHFDGTGRAVFGDLTPPLATRTGFGWYTAASATASTAADDGGEGGAAADTAAAAGRVRLVGPRRAARLPPPRRMPPPSGRTSLAAAARRCPSGAAPRRPACRVGGRARGQGVSLRPAPRDGHLRLLDRRGALLRRHGHLGQTRAAPARRRWPMRGAVYAPLYGRRASARSSRRRRAGLWRRRGPPRRAPAAAGRRRRRTATAAPPPSTRRRGHAATVYQVSTRRPWRLCRGAIASPARRAPPAAPGTRGRTGASSALQPTCARGGACRGRRRGGGCSTRRNSKRSSPFWAPPGPRQVVLSAVPFAPDGVGGAAGWAAEAPDQRVALLNYIADVGARRVLFLSGGAAASTSMVVASAGEGAGGRSWPQRAGPVWALPAAAAAAAGVAAPGGALRLPATGAVTAEDNYTEVTVGLTEVVFSLFSARGAPQHDDARVGRPPPRPRRAFRRRGGRSPSRHRG
ncbi:hypothetical protein BU14_0943s0003 [Porphyra umbilicalis]|uniref:Uncharacterized protein n=1 Tax=Porphyra umbilicalis TaxID=2786 RepID=A0A1X6NN44_PORUM|nr:hypothetical protein BU14_0943s0003 [Porphyra umbilicalis]|eukprot:OSX70034.1 hypothetical protein BU14_0943s0003 [Porphyra umbilicalis]